MIEIDYRKSKNDDDLWLKLYQIVLSQHKHNKTFADTDSWLGEHGIAWPIAENTRVRGAVFICESEEHLTAFLLQYG